MRIEIVTALAFLLSAHTALTATCEEWQHRAASLTPSARASLSRHGAYYDAEWLIFDKALIRPCALRADASYFAGRVINAREIRAGVSGNIRRHASEVTAALARVWPHDGANIPGSDGSFNDELSALLIRPELPVASIRPLLRELMRRGGGVTSDVAFALLTRPDRALLRDVRRARSAAEARQDIEAWTFALAILQRLGQTSVIHQYDVLLARRDLTPQQREVVEGLARKGRAHAIVTWDDVINLEYS